jgi:serine/threonine protein phosphatase PrpC
MNEYNYKIMGGAMAIDYKKEIKENAVKVGVAEIKGRRDYQEDSLQAAVNNVKGFSKLSVADQEDVLKQTFAEIQVESQLMELPGGTTANATIAWLDKDRKVRATTGNLGDSTSFLVILDKNNKLVSSKLMHALHSPEEQTNPAEFKRVVEHARKNNAPLPWKDGLGAPWRLGSGLAMSRSLGDAHQEYAGLSHESEITQTEVSLLPGQKAFIVVACDGLTELDNYDRVLVSHDDIGRMVADGQSGSLLNLANTLVQTAYRRGSGDNISVAVFPVSKTPTSAVVFDGHSNDGFSGARISNFAGETFYTRLQSKIQAKLSLVEYKDVELEDSELDVDKDIEVEMVRPDIEETIIDKEREDGDNLVGTAYNLDPLKKDSRIIVEKPLPYDWFNTFDDDNSEDEFDNTPPPSRYTNQIEDKDKAKIVDEIRERTDKFVAEVTNEILNKILVSKKRNFIIADCRSEGKSTGLDYKISNAKAAKIILAQHPDVLRRYISDFYIDPKTPVKLQSLAMQCYYGFELQKGLKSRSPDTCIQNAKAIFKSPTIRAQLERGHGFWGIIFQFLGWTSGQQLGKFFDKKHEQYEKQHKTAVKQPAAKRTRK